MRSNRNRLPFILMLLGLTVFAAQLLAVGRQSVVAASTKTARRRHKSAEKLEARAC